MPRAKNNQSPPPLPHDAAWRRTLHRRLLAWFGRQARDLPWRQTSDPYAVWVSEIMLQQTQVATVVDYYQRFMAAFPSVTQLAAAAEEDVLRLWEGLGYYRRARQLHRAARVVVEQHGGQFPRDPDVVRGLPGVGRYTAGAILSIAFDQPEPILEANTVRLLARLLAYRGDPRSAAGQRRLWQMAEWLTPQRGAGRLNQALMELGALVCTPREAACDDCPLRLLCPTRAKGWQQQIPAPPVRPNFESVREVAVVVRHQGRVLLWRRGETGRWAGLWDFPRFQLEPCAADESEAIVRQLQALTGARVELGDKLATLRHGVTRFRIELQAYAARYRAGTPRAADGGTLDWVAPERLTDYPLNVTARKLSRLLVD